MQRHFLVHTGDDVTRVELIGDIDVTLRPDAGHALGAALTAGRPVVLDLRRVDFLDSSGIGYLLQFRRACAEVQLPCTLEHVPPQVHLVLDTLGLQDYLLGGTAGDTPLPSPG